MTSRAAQVAEQLVHDWSRDDQRIGRMSGTLETGLLVKRITAALEAEREWYVQLVNSLEEPVGDCPVQGLDASELAKAAIRATKQTMIALIRATPRGEGRDAEPPVVSVSPSDP